MHVTEQPILNMEKAEEFIDKQFPKRTIKRVLLINPPDADVSLFRFDTAKRGRYTNYPPYGLLVLAKNLQKIGIETRICNLNHEILSECQRVSRVEDFDFTGVWEGELDRQMKEFNPDIVGVTCMFTMTHRSFKTVISKIHEYNVPISIGGVHVSNDVDKILDDISEVSFAFLRESEIAFNEFVKVINKTSSVENLAQVILNNSGERYRFTNDLKPSAEDMNIIPAYELIDLDHYSDCGTVGAFYCFKPKGTRFATVLSNRGCRAQCTFCSVRNFNGMGVRQRSITSVVDEIEYLKDRYNVGHIMWLDDDLLKDNSRAIALFHEMIKRKLNITWDATNGLIAASCKDEVIAAAAESGCIAINIGMESGNPEILRQVKKPGTVKSFLQAAEVFRKYEQIHASVFLMVGFPGETMSMVLDTIRVAKEMDLDWCRISQLQPLPNTPIYDSMVQQGIIKEIDRDELRFMGGAYGKQTEFEQGIRLREDSFEKAFASIPLDSVPSAENLTDIWFYMNYHLNFKRLFRETRPVKIEQQFQHLRILCDVISPENGFALYFLGCLQYRVYGKIDDDIVHRLEERLKTSTYWQDRFSAFGLSVGDLRNFRFDDRDDNLVQKKDQSNISVSRV